MSDTKVRNRCWCFTWNNYPENWTKDILTEDFVTNIFGKFKYIIIGFEIGESGTPHLQGYIEFNSARWFTAIKKINPNIHWEIRRGTPEQAIDYCKKDGNFVEYGEKPIGQGTRTDLLAMTYMLESGKSERDVLLAHGDKALRVVSNLTKVKSLLREQKRNWEMDVRIYCGPPGTGKTRSVWDEFGVNNVYAKMTGKWWDGYNFEPVVLIDDFDPDNCFDMQYDFYLKLLDRYPVRVEYKGGSCEFCSKIIIFTSNYDPADWFKNKENRGAFFRRIKTIKYFDFDTDTDTEVV